LEASHLIGLGLRLDMELDETVIVCEKLERVLRVIGAFRV
jgi:hypothetical protein